LAFGMGAVISVMATENRKRCAERPLGKMKYA